MFKFSLSYNVERYGVHIWQANMIVLDLVLVNATNVGILEHKTWKSQDDNDIVMF